MLGTKVYQTFEKISKKNVLKKIDHTVPYLQYGKKYDDRMQKLSLYATI